MLNLLVDLVGQCQNSVGPMLWTHRWAGWWNMIRIFKGLMWFKEYIVKPQRLRGVQKTVFGGQTR